MRRIKYPNGRLQRKAHITPNKLGVGPLEKEYTLKRASLELQNSLVFRDTQFGNKI